MYFSNELRQKKHGIPTVSSESIGSLLKAKAADRTPEIHEQYKKSHNSYGISEKVNRNYTGFDSEKVYGESTGKVFVKVIWFEPYVFAPWNENRKR